jgi:hypothetical protein
VKQNLKAMPLQKQRQTGEYFWVWKVEIVGIGSRFEFRISDEKIGI